MRKYMKWALIQNLWMQFVEYMDDKEVWSYYLGGKEFTYIRAKQN